MVCVITRFFSSPAAIISLCSHVYMRFVGFFCFVLVRRKQILPFFALTAREWLKSVLCLSGMALTFSIADHYLWCYVFDL